jgi:hypothetical protein
VKAGDSITYRGADWTVVKLEIRGFGEEQESWAHIIQTVPDGRKSRTIAAEWVRKRELVEP